MGTKKYNTFELNTGQSGFLVTFLDRASTRKNIEHLKLCFVVGWPNPTADLFLFTTFSLHEKRDERRCKFMDL